jgi:hypothetical protein
VKSKSSGRPPVAQDIVEDIREKIEDNPNISLWRLALQSKSTALLSFAFLTIRMLIW